MSRKRRISGAPVAMHVRGELTDSIVLEEIMKKPGLTVSEIADRLGWTNGKVDGSVNRLVLRGKASVKHCLRRGMLVKMVFPLEYLVKSPEIVEIPKEMVDYEVWQDSAIVYALSRSTIGISYKEIAEWDKKAFFKECVSIEISDENIVLKLPEKFARFYQLDNSDISLSTIGNCVLVSVESILPVKLPPIYPEETKHEVTYYRMKLEIEGVSSYNPLFDYLGKAKEIRSSSQTLYAALRKKLEDKILTATSSEPCRERLKIPVEVR
ncbi:winged helix-turn-helix domain-containing protein [Candidatus Bathyarchaeota archaeon]|nr:winged helix-turn-helix domain-containing protein [Candidatus Bathyarchaeota archaeon]